MSSRLKEIAEKKGDILSKILKVDLKSLREAKAATRSKRSQSSSSGMDTQVIANIQNRINNPLFSLKIADYELMCGNKVITKMMSKVLECDEKQLKKFCKYINVFKENIKSSPKSIKNKMKPVTKMTLNKLPEELRTQIVQKYMTLFPTKYELRDWIPIDKIHWNELSKNPNAIELIREKIKDENELSPEDLNDLDYRAKIDWVHISNNPNAIELLEEKLKKEQEENIDDEENEYIDYDYEELNPAKINWTNLSLNPSAIGMLNDNKDKIKWDQLSRNKSVGAIELLRKKIRSENNLSREQLEDLPDSKKIEWYNLSENPNAIELLRENIDKIKWDRLSNNLNAIELLRENKKSINWWTLSENPNAIELLSEKIKQEMKMNVKDLNKLDDTKKIDWVYLSGNPNAIELLIANQDKIDWDALSSNPNAIKLLRANQDKIDWGELSSNPNAIELLREHRDKIIWSELSSNPNAIELLIERMNEEKNMSEINIKNKINWSKLSENRNAIELLKANPNKINWANFSKQPFIFEEERVVYTTYAKSPAKSAKAAKASKAGKAAKAGNAKKECPVGKELNPLTKRCIKICEKDKIRDPVTRRCKKKCPVGKELNPLTKRCIKICEKDKIRDPVTGKCKKI